MRDDIMVLRRYSVAEEGFWKYSIVDDVIQGSLEDYEFEDKDEALKKCRNLNLRQRKNSIYKQNKLTAGDLEIAEKIKISINLTDCTVFDFEINKNAKKLKDFISNCKYCEISAVENNIENKIEEIIIEES